MRVADLRIGDVVIVRLGATEREARVTGFRAYPSRLTWVTVDVIRGPRNIHMNPRYVLRRVSRRLGSRRASRRADAQAGND